MILNNNLRMHGGISMSDVQLVKCLNEIVGRFIWLNINPDSECGLRTSYGYITGVIDDRLIRFHPIDNECKISGEMYIAVKDIDGLCWKGAYIDRFKLKANMQNLRVKPEILKEKEAKVAAIPRIKPNIQETFNKFKDEMKANEQYLEDLSEYLKG